MDKIETVKKLIGKGFHLGLLPENKKFPPEKGWQSKTTNDFNKFQEKLLANPRQNLLIDTGKFKEKLFLTMIDIDNKGGKNGYDTILKLELEGKILPPTYCQKTPTGGEHRYYWSTVPIRNGVSNIGDGVDTRGVDGYGVAAGSSINGIPYTHNDHDVAMAPDWVLEMCNKKEESHPLANQELPGINKDRAYARAKEYILNAEPAIEGQGGDQKTFLTAIRLKDFGVNEQICYELMSNDWNDRCLPPWDENELKQKVRNAYSYGNEPIGINAPETQFERIEEPQKTLSPIEQMNKEYAYIWVKGKDAILRTVNNGIDILTLAAFHNRHAGDKVLVDGGKPRQLTRDWMESRGVARRTYNGLDFAPDGKPKPGHYNLFRGFAYQPSRKESAKAFEGFHLFLNHVLENICGGNQDHYQYLMAHTAHIFQKPWEKTGVATVFKGEKGTGKTIWSETIANLIGPNHAFCASNRRFILSNFNSHMEGKLFISFEEAHWAGDKQTDSLIKDLITGSTIFIERKGFEPYVMPSFSRIHFNSNNDLVVSVTKDERRYAIFEVGNNKQQDIKYFGAMIEGLKAGGYKLLMQYFLEFDISKVELRNPPQTKEKINQLLEGLTVIEAWWFESLKLGALAYRDFQTEWETQVDKITIRDCIKKYADGKKHTGWLPSEDSIGRKFKKMCKSLITNQKRKDGDKTIWIYRLPDLATARKEFEEYIKGTIDWDE